MVDKKLERRGLGRGLSALMADVGAGPQTTEDAPRRADLLVPIELIEPKGNQLCNAQPTGIGQMQHCPVSDARLRMRVG